MPLFANRFVIKTVDEKGQKVFINICGSSKIAAPGVNWENGQVALSDAPTPNRHQSLFLSAAEDRCILSRCQRPSRKLWTRGRTWMRPAR